MVIVTGLADMARKKALIALLVVLLTALAGEVGPRLLIRDGLSAFEGDQRTFAASALTQARYFFGGSLEPVFFTALRVEDVVERTSAEGQPCYEATVGAYTLFGLPRSSVVVSCNGSARRQ